MGRIYKRKNQWYIDFSAKGRRFRRAVGPSKRVAERALLQAEIEAAEGRFGIATHRDLTIEELFGRFMEYSRTHHRPGSTVRYESVVKQLQRFFATHPNVRYVSDITVEVVDLFIIRRRSQRTSETDSGRPEDTANLDGRSTRAAKAKTINFEIDALRFMLNLAIKWGYLKDNVCTHVSRLKEDDRKKPRFLSLDECHRLLEASPTELYRIYYTFLTTGMRKGELEHLQWGDVDFQNNRLRIRAKAEWRPKSGERDIPFTDGLHQVLLEMWQEQVPKQETEYVFNVFNDGRSRNWMREQLIRVANKAGIADLTMLHTLRHTYASQLVMANVPLPTVQRLLGHADIQTTMIYSHLAPDHFVDSVKKLPL